MKWHTLKLTYQDPTTDAAPETFDVYMGLLMSEAQTLENHAKLEVFDWLRGIDNREPMALQFFYWLARKRAGNPVDGPPSSVDLWIDGFTTELVDRGDFPDENAEEPSTELVGPDPTVDAGISS